MDLPNSTDGAKVVLEVIARIADECQIAPGTPQKGHRIGFEYEGRVVDFAWREGYYTTLIDVYLMQRGAFGVLHNAPLFPAPMRLLPAVWDGWNYADIGVQIGSIVRYLRYGL